jgi:hypothetical protein
LSIPVYIKVFYFNEYMFSSLDKKSVIQDLSYTLFIAINPAIECMHQSSKTSSISACDSSDLIGPETKKYSKVRVNVHVE